MFTARVSRGNGTLGLHVLLTECGLAGQHMSDVIAISFDCLLCLFVGIGSEGS
jgi:hypothetical protein